MVKSIMVESIEVNIMDNELVVKLMKLNIMVGKQWLLMVKNGE